MQYDNLKASRIDWLYLILYKCSHSIWAIGAFGQSAETKLLNDLIQKRQEKEGDAMFLTRPVLNTTDTTHVQIAINPYQLIDLDEEKQSLSIHLVEEMVTWFIMIIMEDNFCYDACFLIIEIRNK